MKILLALFLSISFFACSSTQPAEDYSKDKHEANKAFDELEEETGK